jgi:WXXGXW repeat (2 copies)
MRLANLRRTLVFVVALLGFAIAGQAQAWVGVSVTLAPPVLPVYVQPPCPGPGYLWTPGYWAYDNVYGYYWVPGTWVLAPVGLLWTPGYWAFEGGLYVWNPGYWGPEVGFYGGINYGFGYFGRGYDGGYWRDREFFYNRAVTRIDGGSIRNVYSRPAAYDHDERHASFNGPGGVQARPSAAEQAAAHAPHYGFTADQRRHELTARSMPELRAAANRGHPVIAATPRPGVFHGGSVSVGQRSEVSRAGPAPDVRRSETSRAGSAEPRAFASGGAPKPREAPAANRAPRAQPAPQQRYEAHAQPAPQQHDEPRAQPAPQQHYEPRAQPAPQQRYEPRSAPVRPYEVRPSAHAPSPEGERRPPQDERRPQDQGGRG